MLKLDIKTEPYWIDLPGKVRVKVKPVNTAVMSAAQAEAAMQYNALPQKPQSETERKGISESLLVAALATFAIMEWEGVMLSDGTTLAPITPETVRQLMDYWLIADEFLKKYVSQIGLQESEGNASAPAANGITAEASSSADNAS